MYQPRPAGKQVVLSRRLALTKNPDQAGQVLLIAGATGEGTAAAGRFIAQRPRLNATLKNLRG